MAAILASKNTHGTLMFFAGLGLTIREALVGGAERPSLYILYAGMMGLPFVWGARPGGNGNGSTPKPDNDPPSRNRP